MDKNIHSHKNLHSKVLLTEFSRDFDSFNSDSLLSKFFNKVTLAYNNVNSYQEALPTTSTSEANKDDVVTVALQNSGSSGSSIESHSKSPKTSPIQTVASSVRLSLLSMVSA